MLKFVTGRLLTMIPILLGVLLISVLLMDLVPGDPARTMAGETATPEVVESIRQHLGLDDPVWTRFARYVGNVLQGDLGKAPNSRDTVASQIWAALPVTISLAIVGMAMAILLGVAGGTLAALQRGRFLDRAVTVLAAVLQATPPFVIGLGLVILFAINRSWFPATGYTPFLENPVDWIYRLILPGLTIAAGPAAELARQTRSAMVDTLEQDYIRVSRAKGLSEWRVVGKHAAKNAATPVVTVIGLQAGRILGGTAIVELIFGMTGFGFLAFNAVLSRDIVLVQAVVLISATAVLVSNLLVDVSYGFLNPKVRV